MKYFNGYEKKTGKRVIVEIYDNPEPNLFDERDVLGRVSYVEKTGFTMIYDMEDLFNLYNIREIPDEEYMIFRRAQLLIENFWQRGRTGGFPTKDALRMSRLLNRSVGRYFCEKEARSLKEEGRTLSEIASAMNLDKVEVRPMKEVANGEA